jgi:hypothetical protein
VKLQRVFQRMCALPVAMFSEEFRRRKIAHFASVHDPHADGGQQVARAHRDEVSDDAVSVGDSENCGEQSTAWPQRPVF